MLYTAILSMQMHPSPVAALSFFRLLLIFICARCFGSFSTRVLLHASRLTSYSLYYIANRNSKGRIKTTGSNMSWSYMAGTNKINRRTLDWFTVAHLTHNHYNAAKTEQTKKNMTTIKSEISRPFSPSIIGYIKCLVGVKVVRFAIFLSKVT